MRYLALLVLVGCTSSEPTFEYNATASWATESTPNVTSVMIDGHAVASHEQYVIHETYPSYDDALAAFAAHPVVVTTTTQTLTFALDIGACENAAYMFSAPFTSETDHFSLSPGLQGGDALSFGALTGKCESSDGHVIAWAARTR
jgi:hypothetical protein